MDRVHRYLKPQYMGLKHPIFTWLWVNFPIKINGGQIGGPKYLN